MDGIDHRFKITIIESRKKKKEKHFEAFVHWPSEGNLLRQVRLTAIETVQKKPSSYWEHRYNDGTNTKKWMSLPVSGKLKDITGKKVGKKDFSFSDLSVTEKDINSHNHNLLNLEKVDTLSAHVILLIKKNKKGKVKESKKMWIDTEHYMIMKVEFYTRSGRLYRRVECSGFHYLNKILFPKNIIVQDFKSKNDFQITITDIELDPVFDRGIFIPKDQ
jgi:hypothetical protein